MRLGRLRVVFVLLALAGAAPRASAQVTRIEVVSREPMAAGQAVGAAGPYEIVRGRIHGEVDPTDRRNAIIQDLVAGAAQRARPGRIRRHVRAGEAGRSRQGLRRADLQRGEPRQRIAAGLRRRRRVAGQRVAGRPAAGRRQADDRRARRAQRRRHADHRPDDRALRQRGARHDDAADPPRDDRQPAAGVSARRPRAARRPPDQRRQRNHRRRPSATCARCRAPTGRSPTAAPCRFPGRPTRRSCA